ncbi:PilW family protein [Parashewanella tropica]|uniref:PilW family protein n=1 Tax=Parashewanella tropica TaxID=2547970 RepID=UPI00105996C4|nr:type II secretion system protein [Parashewanella tropica]
MIRSFKKAIGFTLIELITVIVILGIVLVGVSSFITFGTRIFVDSTSVDQVLGESRFAIQRMTRELRTALPNSVRVNTDNVSYQCIEFVPTITSTSYIQLPLTAPSNTAIVFRDDTNSKISIFQRAYVYPINANEIYITNTQNSIAAMVFGSRGTSNPPASSPSLTVTFNAPTRFKYSSPQKRIYFTNFPVTYCISGVSHKVERFERYGFNTALPTPQNRGSGSVIAQSLVNDISNASDRPFNLLPSTLQHSAIIQMNLRFEVLGQSMSYQHQVQVPNVP